MRLVKDAKAFPQAKFYNLSTWGAIAPPASFPGNATGSNVGSSPILLMQIL